MRPHPPTHTRPFIDEDKTHSPVVHEPACGEYRLIEEIGRGSSRTAIYLAEREEPGRGVGDPRCAVKKLVRGRGMHLGRADVDGFAREVAFMQSLDHANIVRVFDGAGGAEPFLVMELLAGVPLGRLARRLAHAGQLLPPALSTFIAHEVLAALSHVHELRDTFGQPLGAVHGRLRPKDVMLTRAGQTKLLAFGPGTTGGAAVLSTLGVRTHASYAAPEQIAGRACDARVDQFAVGALLWELLVGPPLFWGATEDEALAAVLTKEVPPPSSLRPRIPARVDAIVMRALARDPRRRFPSAEAMVGELGRNLPPQSRLTRCAADLVASALGGTLTEDTEARARADRARRRQGRPRTLPLGTWSLPRKQADNTPEPGPTDPTRVQAPPEFPRKRPTLPPPLPIEAVGARIVTGGELTPAPTPAGSATAPVLVQDRATPTPVMVARGRREAPPPGSSLLTAQAAEARRTPTGLRVPPALPMPTRTPTPLAGDESLLAAAAALRPDPAAPMPQELLATPVIDAAAAALAAAPAGVVTAPIVMGQIAPAPVARRRVTIMATPIRLSGIADALSLRAGARAVVGSLPSPQSFVSQRPDTPSPARRTPGQGVTPSARFTPMPTSVDGTRPSSVRRRIEVACIKAVALATIGFMGGAFWHQSRGGESSQIASTALTSPASIAGGPEITQLGGSTPAAPEPAPAAPIEVQPLAAAPTQPSVAVSKAAVALKASKLSAAKKARLRASARMRLAVRRLSILR